jgi:tRNA G46 methylase TrmB
MNIKKEYKKYCNENFLRFNQKEEQIWKNFDKEFGEERTDELNQLFVDRYKDPTKGNPYSFCKNFKETSTLMYFQSDFFLENSLKILELFEQIKPNKILELGCYNGILLNYLAEKYTSQNFTGLDVEKNIIRFAKEKFNQKNLNFLPLEYKRLSELNDKFDLIFTLFGIENIPGDIRLDKFEIRDNKDYQVKYDYFSNFFNNLKSIIKDKTLFCPLIRIPDLNCLMAFLDVASNNKWKLKDNKIDFVESRNLHNEIERIPFFILEHLIKEDGNDKIEIDNFFKITKQYRNEDNLRYIYLYYKNKSNFNEIVKSGEIFYKDDQTTLYYKIFKRLGTSMLFLWATNGFSYYGEFTNLDEVKKLFLELTSRELEL